jgi:hypothetical protein
MDQPVYWGDRSKADSEKKQYVKESQDLKTSGGNMYPGSTVPHPTNDLQDIFSKADRVNAYQTSPRDAVSSIKGLNGEAGAQLSISGGLMENIQSLALASQWGYASSWWSGYKEARGWTTGSGFPRLDIVAFTNDHVLSPLVSERTLKKQILAHKYTCGKYYGTTPVYSKGYWPAECAFSERIIKTLKECGLEWVVIPNSHLARTMADYVHPYNINGNIDPPNKADIMNSKPGNHWQDGSIDGRGTRLAAPFCYQAHKAKYVDPATGIEYVIDVVPMCNYLSYVDGYSGASVSDVQSRVAQYNDNAHPSIVLLAHDGDNAWGGGYSYYYEAVNSFAGAAKNAGMIPTTIQQFLSENPVPATDVVHVEDGAWVNADSDWGHPQFINWLWPLYTSDYKFDPDGWTEDARNWAVITATDNYVAMAEDLTGTLNIANICEGGSAANNAEKAWHFYFGGLNSGFMYYGKAEDMEVKASLTGNIAIEYAQKVIDANPGTDHTPPSVFIPQRYPYNPGGYGFGPTTGYKKIVNDKDFTVWTLAYDVNGLASVTLKYRVDNDTIDPINNNDNKTYAGGPAVGSWQSLGMTRKAFAADPANDPELNYFILPKAKADLCYAKITGFSNTLLDYYVEAADTKGNVYSSPIQHVYVADGSSASGGGTATGLSWTPVSPTSNDTITITYNPGTAGSYLHWGVNNWTKPDNAYASVFWSDNVAARTSFASNGNGSMSAKIGPFNKSQSVSQVNLTIQFGGGNWLGSNSTIQVSQAASAVESPAAGSLLLNVYPQPMVTKCLVSVPNSAPGIDYLVKIISTDGCVLRQFTTREKDIVIDKKDLQSGVYLLRVIDMSSGRVYTSRLLVG